MRNLIKRIVRYFSNQTKAYTMSSHDTTRYLTSKEVNELHRKILKMLEK